MRIKKIFNTKKKKIIAGGIILVVVIIGPVNMLITAVDNGILRIFVLFVLCITRYFC